MHSAGVSCSHFLATLIAAGVARLLKALGIACAVHTAGEIRSEELALSPAKALERVRQSAFLGRYRWV